MKLQNKRVLVTGGSSGIGFALAQALIARGARVFITGRRQAVLDDSLHRLSSAGGACADVGTAEGRAATLEQALTWLGGLDLLVNNAGGVRAGRLEHISSAEIEQMVTVDLLAPILLTQTALAALRDSGDAMVVNIASGIALVGAPFYTTYAAVKAGLAHFGEALRRELKGEGIHVLTAYPGGTDTPMMRSNRAGPELGFSREPAEAVAAAIIEGIETDAFEVIRGGETRAQMIALNRTDPAAVDAKFLSLKIALEEAVKDHSAL
jgi:short-subunit dehydrogenase